MNMQQQQERRSIDELPPLIRINDFLHLLPISRSSVWTWVREGRFPKPFKLGGVTVWRREDIHAWLLLDAPRADRNV